MTAGTTKNGRLTSIQSVALTRTQSVRSRPGSGWGTFGSSERGRGTLESEVWRSRAESSASW